jgi:hypothetical protein
VPRPRRRVGAAPRPLAAGGGGGSVLPPGLRRGAASCAGVAGREIMRRSRAGWVGGGRWGGSCWQDFRGGTTGRRDVRERGHGEQRVGIHRANWQNRAPNHCVDAYVKGLRNSKDIYIY